MDILELVDSLEENVENAFVIPFIGKCFLNKDDVLESLQEIRLKFPEELKNAKWIIEERQRILLDAQKEADSILKNAAEQITQMVSEHEIVKKANEHAMTIMEQAQNEAREIRLGTKEYANEILNDLESRVSDALKKIRDDKIGL